MGQSLGCIQVDQSTVAVKEHFGKFDKVLEPGCHCVPWCFGYGLAGKLSLRVNQLDVRCETKTKVLFFFTTSFISSCNFKLFYVYLQLLIISLIVIFYFRTMCLLLWLHLYSIVPCLIRRLMLFISFQTPSNKFKLMFSMVRIDMFYMCFCFF